MFFEKKNFIVMILINFPKQKKMSLKHQIRPNYGKRPAVPGATDSPKNDSKKWCFLIKLFGCDNIHINFPKRKKISLKHQIWPNYEKRPPVAGAADSPKNDPKKWCFCDKWSESERMRDLPHMVTWIGFITTGSCPLPMLAIQECSDSWKQTKTIDGNWADGCR